MARIDSDDPTALIGLPLIATTRLLAQFGLDPLEHLPAFAPGSDARAAQGSAIASVTAPPPHLPTPQLPETP
ncbi:Maf-like protein [Mycobacteroides abscessus subsp. abscessus]|nr:Maf-like protein [Mycobacteroides abscessus subsp. abscessus]